jgi:mannose-6-phosphate isomerase-like protein (cupin superfamily)
MWLRAKHIRKSWGREQTLYSSDLYTFKVLNFRQGGRTHLHFHSRRTKTWFVESGGFDLVLMEAATGKSRKRALTQGVVVHLPPGLPHKLSCFKAGRIFEAGTPPFKGDTHRLKLSKFSG